MDIFHLLPIIVLCVSSALFSGSLWRHQRILTLLAAAGAIWETQWLLLTLLARTLLVHYPLLMVFTTGSILLAVVAGTQIRHWSWPYSHSPDSGLRDIAILPVIAIVLLASWLVASRNGIQGTDFVWHGFYNGDTATFISLVQKSLLAPGLTHANPFAGNGVLEYPTLIHASLAQLLQFNNIGLDWLRFLPLFTYAQIFITIPIFFLLFDVLALETTNQYLPWFGIHRRKIVYALQTLLVLLILSPSWDSYVYPQSHYFITGLFLLLAPLLGTAYAKRGPSQLPQITFAGVLALVLLGSNAVFGTAAIAIVATFCLWRGLDSSRPILERELFLASIPVLIVAFLIFSPGQSSISLFHIRFSYSAAQEMLHFGLLPAALLIGTLFGLKKQPWLAATAVILSLLGFITFFFSSRGIVIENSARFLYLAILVSFPLLVPVIIQVFFWIRKSLWLSTTTITDKISGWGALLLLGLLCVLPSLASIASAHNNLMFLNEETISSAERQALWWIEDNTKTGTVILASPDIPWAVPILTGRSLLRTNYWLSPDDQLLASINRAFTGDRSDQNEVTKQADYLLLSKTERTSWEPLKYKKVFDDNAFVIYELTTH